MQKPGSRPAFIAAALLSLAASGEQVPFAFVDSGAASGITAITTFGGRHTNTYLIETTGAGAAVFDYDNDGLPDLLFVNGSRLEGFPPGKEPRVHLYRNLGSARFELVRGAAGLDEHFGWGQGVCAGDYDGNGVIDLLITYYGQNRLYRNDRGRFRDRTNAAGLTTPATRWNTGCAFLDYDRDGDLDLFVANYVDVDLATSPTPDSGPCRYKGALVACGPRGLKGGANLLFRNRGDGTFDDVSEASGITRAQGTFGLGVVTLDFDDDGWVDVYVANDTEPSSLYRNNHDGTFEDIGLKAGCALSEDGSVQAGMGVSAGDFDRNGTIDLVKTNFAGDTSTLYANTGEGVCEDRTIDAGLGLNTRWLAWGAGFADFDNDGWLDIFLTNGHVYPEARQIRGEAGYEQPKVVYRNVGGEFQEVTDQLGLPATRRRAGRGTAFGDVDNNGTVDVAINNTNDVPDLYLTRSPKDNAWLLIRLVGTRSNRSAIGARVRVAAGPVRQVEEVRGGGSYLSQNDLRVHFGLGSAARVDRIEVRWPNGRLEQWTNISTRQVLTLTEGTGTPLNP